MISYRIVPSFRYSGKAVVHSHGPINYEGLYNTLPVALSAARDADEKFPLQDGEWVVVKLCTDSCD